MSLNETIDSSEQTSVSNEMAAAVRFRESFWGERANGYEVLLQNLRNSQTSVKEFIQFLRESASSEEQYVKQLQRVTAQVQKFRADSSMSPLWLNVLGGLNEHNSSRHLHYMAGLQELVKEADVYLKALRKKKRTTKETELRTQEAVERYRLAKTQHHKSKDQYHLISFELDKQQQLLRLNQQQLSTNPATITAITNSIQKLEKKKQACLEEYQSSIEKFNQSRSEYVRRLESSSDVFQALEEEHVAQMRAFIQSYLNLINKLNAGRQKDFSLYSERLINVYSSDFLLRELVRIKALGQERPQAAEFEDASAVTLKSIKNSNYGESLSLDLVRGGATYGSRRSFTMATTPIKMAAAPSLDQHSADDLSDNSSHLFNSNNNYTASSLNSKNTTTTPTMLSVSLPQGSLQQTNNGSFSMLGPGYSVIADVSNSSNNNNNNNISLYDMNLSNSSSVHNGHTTSNSNSHLLLDNKRNSSGLQGLINMDFLGRRSKKDAGAAGTVIQQTSTPKKASANKLAQFATFEDDSVQNGERKSPRRLKNNNEDTATSSITDRVEATFGESIMELNQLEMEANSKKMLKTQRKNDSQLDAGSENSKSTKSSERSSLGGFTKKLFGKQLIAQGRSDSPPVNDKHTSASSSSTKMAFIDSVNSQNDDEDDFFPAFDDIELSVRNKTNSDMNNLYELSESSGDEEDAHKQHKMAGNQSTDALDDTDNLSPQKKRLDSDSDSDTDSDSSDDSDAPMRVMLRIKPKSEMTDRDQMVSPDVLRMISKNLILNSPSDKMLSSRNRAHTTAITVSQTPPPSSTETMSTTTTTNGTGSRLPASLPRPQIPPRPKDFSSPGSTNEFTSSTTSSTSYSMNSPNPTVSMMQMMSGSAYSQSIFAADSRPSTSPSFSATSNTTSRSASAVSFLYNNNNNNNTHDLLASPNHFNSPVSSSSGMLSSNSSNSPLSRPNQPEPAPPLPPLPAHIQERFNEKQKLYMLRKELPLAASSVEISPVSLRSPNESTVAIIKRNPSNPPVAPEEHSQKRVSLKSIETASVESLSATIEPVAKYSSQLSSKESTKRSSRIELRKLNLNLASDESITEL